MERAFCPARVSTLRLRKSEVGAAWLELGPVWVPGGPHGVRTETLSRSEP